MRTGTSAIEAPSAASESTVAAKRVGEPVIALANLPFTPVASTLSRLGTSSADELAKVNSTGVYGPASPGQVLRFSHVHTPTRIMWTDDSAVLAETVIPVCSGNCASSQVPPKATRFFVIRDNAVTGFGVGTPVMWMTR